ncbi:unnamed protein product [Microthlaspi erraticum]|uniref:Uncharacterized protein n=1 Tax=Microthlaspi erraticum TaxID=1685480 RepID=A0A6D2JNQ9_9BRAS|nr:unnamed protein product [Microthlaspi erraticum]
MIQSMASVVKFNVPTAELKHLNGEILSPITNHSTVVLMIGFVYCDDRMCVKDMNEMWWNATVVYDEVLDRVELRNSTGWSSRWSSWSSRWLPPSSFAYPVELRPCTKSFHAPHVPYAPKCSKRPISKDQTCICMQMQPKTTMNA